MSTITGLQPLEKRLLEIKDAIKYYNMQVTSEKFLDVIEELEQMVSALEVDES